MDQTILVTPDFKIADEILQALDDAKFPVTVAAWVLSNGLGGWQFVVGTPLYDKIGANAYGPLIEAVRANDPTSLLFDEVRLMGNRSPFIRELRRSLVDLRFVKGMKIGGEFGNLYVPDARIYRIK